MDKVLTQLINSISSGDMWIVVLIIILSILFNFERIVTFFDYRKKVKISLIEETLKKPHITGVTKNLRNC